MQRVFSSSNIAEVDFFASLLESSGVECMVKNQNLTVARGELPPADTWPEVWVIDNAKAQEAMDILSQAKSMQYTAADEWVCPGCGEKIEGQFTSCWNCGREKD